MSTFTHSTRPPTGNQRKRRTGSLASKLDAFFAANPDEELTLDDVCTKFDAPKATAEARLCEEVRAGRLQRVTVYRKTQETA